MKREKQLIYYFLTKGFFQCSILSFLLYGMSSSEGSSSPLHQVFLVMAFVIFIPVYFVKFSKTKNESLILKNGVINYNHGVFLKKSLDILLTSVKLVQLRQGWLADAFGLTKLLVTCEVPMTLSANQKNIQMQNSIRIQYITIKEEAEELRDLLNKRV